MEDSRDQTHLSQNAGLSIMMFRVFSVGNEEITSLLRFVYCVITMILCTDGKRITNNNPCFNETELF